MRAQLKGKRSASQEMSHTSSHKTTDSITTVEDSKPAVKSSSPALTSSNEPSRSATKPVPLNTDGRSGSFTSYTPLPKFPEPRRPSSPVIPYGRPPRPSIEIPTGMRGPSIPGSPERSGQRRGSGSDVRRPIIEIGPSTVNRSASNSPVIGSLPFSTQNDNSSDNGRPSSRNRNRRDDIVGKLPVFAPREGLPDLHGSIGGERMGRPQSPARGVSPGSQQTRPQSPARGISPARSIPLPPADKASRTPSPLHNIHEETKELPVSTTIPTTSPLKPVLISKNTATLVNVASQIEVPPKPVAARVVSPTPPPPPPITQTSQPLSPRPGKKVTLPAIQISIPPPVHPQIDPTRSPSPDAEWKDSDEDDSEVLPIDKRTTIFLQEAGKRKESLPPLPTEPAPPLPQSLAKHEGSPPSLPTQPSPPLPLSSDPEDPVEMLIKQLENTSSLLIPPSTAPVHESRVTGSGIDSSIVPSHQPETEPAAKQAAYPPERPHTPVAKPPSVPSALSGGVESSDDRQLRLPELDESRPITWGPLTFESFKDAEKPNADKSDEVVKVDKSEDIEEESDWEKIDRDEAREEMHAVMTSQETPHKDLEGKQTRELEVQSHTEGIDVLPEVIGNQQSSPPAHDSMEIREVEHSTESQQTVPAVRETPSEIHEAVDTRDVSEEPMEATSPPESVSDHDSVRRLDKGKDKEVHGDEHIADTKAMSSVEHSDTESTFRSKYIDRDITSFINPKHVNMSHNDERPETSRDYVPPLQMRTVSEEPSIQPFSIEYLPAFMFAKDIPEMSTVAQRVGAYQSRRDQMIKVDTGLRGWLLQAQHCIPASLPPRITIPLTLLNVAPPEIKRLSRDLRAPPASPSTAASPFASGGKTGRAVISKMKIGGKRLGTASKNALAASPTEQRGSGELHYTQENDEVMRTTLQQRSSPENRSEASSPVVSKSEGLPQADLRSSTQEEQDDVRTSQDYSGDSQRVALGLSTPTQPYSPDSNPPPTPFVQIRIPSERSQSPVSYPPTRRAETPNNPRSPGQEMSRNAGKAGGRHGYSSSTSGVGNIVGLFGQTSESKAKHHSDSTDYPAQRSPNQKSKFSRFVSDISRTTLGGSRPGQSAITPPPPPDKSQFRATSEGSGKLKGFFADVSSRDITGSRPSDRQQASAPRETSPRAPQTSPRTGGDERSGTGGFGRFLSDLSRRDIAGQTEQDRAAAARRRQQEATHIPAQTVVYDENASDWEDKMTLIEDVLPHIRRELLVESLKQSGGDAQRAIGLAVIRSRG